MAVQNFGSGGGGFQLSPGINVSEIDLTTVVPSVDTSAGAIAGVFRWGPVGQRILVTSENDLANKFGKPTNINAETWFVAASFLSYSNALYVSRALNANQFSAVATSNTASINASSSYTILNSDDYLIKSNNFTSSGATYIARYPGELGNSLKVSVCGSATQYNSTIDLKSTAYNCNNSNTSMTLAVGSTTASITLFTANGSANQTSSDAILNLITVGDYIQVGNAATFGTQYLKIISKSATSLSANLTTGNTASFTLTFDQPLKLSTDINTSTVNRYWEYYNQVDVAPGRSTYVSVNGNTVAQLGNTAAQNDELHIVIVDEEGGFTSSPGAILEVYKGLSRASDSKLSDGTTNYYKDVINNESNYVWFGTDRVGSVSNTAVNIVSSINQIPLTLSFTGGIDKNETEDPSTGVSFADIAKAYDLFVSSDDVDVSLIMTGLSRGFSGAQSGNYLIDNLAETRRDCVVFVSPPKSSVVNNTQPVESILGFRSNLRSSSYAVVDSGYKYMYDKYNDIYRYIPLNGDIAGVCARTDKTRDPWFSPAGTTRGSIKNVIKLAFNPNQAQRDQLYKNSINPVVNISGQGPTLYGDKTFLNKPSAFDRINVRRLFIVLEKAISNASKSLLFEFNDEFTRSQFRNLIEPYLRDVQGRRGIYDFKVICDETNNTSEVIDGNRFVGDIYIKPARSINYIQLNFVAVRSGVEFSEIAGA